MKTAVIFFVLSLGLSSFAQRADIQLGEAKTKKSLVAIPAFHYLGSAGAKPNYQSIGSELYNVISNDLLVSSYFQMIPQSAYLEDTNKTALIPAPQAANGFKFQSWQAIGTDFLIRGGFSTIGSDVQLEIYAYHVSKGTLILGKKYRGSTLSIRKVAHTFANEFLEALTGKKGMYLSKIVTTSDRGGGPWREVWVMDWDGANADQVSSHKTTSLSPAWSPDGKKIAYTATVMHKQTKMRNHDLFVYELFTGKRTMVSYRQGMNSGAAFSPDGQYIYLTISQGTSPEIYKIDLDGAIAAKLTNGPNSAMNVEPAVRADGGKIAFSSDRSGKTMIFTMNTDGSSVKRLTTAGKYNSSPAWSPDGKKIAFAGYENNHFDIFVMDSDGTNMIRITKATKQNGRAANNEDPYFSPDGRFVIYTSDRSGKNQIYISTVDGSEERRVTADSFNYYKPRWSNNFE